MKKFLLFFLNFIFLINSPSQIELTDTLSLARNKAFESKFNEANLLLKKYNQDHQNKFALQLQAQILYWMNKPDEAEKVYERGLQLFPDYSPLKLDYARLLFQLSKYQKAKKIFNDYLLRDINNAEANISVAFIDLQNGHLSEAKKRAEKMLTLYPGIRGAVDILNQISKSTSPYVQLNTYGYSDDQPLKMGGFEPEAGVYKSWLLSLQIRASLMQSVTAQSNSFFELYCNDKINIVQTKTKFDVGIGYFRSNTYSGGLTWKLKLNQGLTPYFSVDIGTEKRPYLYTAASAKNAFLFNLSDFGINLDLKNRWLGRAAYQHQYFYDGNNVNVLSAWLLAPVIQTKYFWLKAGYSFSYSNSNLNKFEPKEAFNGVYVSGKVIEGVYNPYFTPNKQWVNSVIASIGIPISQKLSLNGRAEYGFLASANQPYFYIDKETNGKFFVHKEFEKYNYHPLILFGEVSLMASKSFFIKINYTYNDLIYFKSNAVNLQLKYFFNHEK